MILEAAAVVALFLTAYVAADPDVEMQIYTILCVWTAVVIAFPLIAPVALVGYVVGLWWAKVRAE